MDTAELAQEVVNEEIEAVRKLEIGPSKAELRLNKIVEM